MSSQCGGPFTFTEDSAAGIVVEGLQPGSLRHGASGPDNITVRSRRGENVRFKEEKKRLGKKPRDTMKQTDIAGHLGTNRVDVVGPHKCVIDGDSQELEGTNLFNLIAFNT